jgi:hypothetical protein
MVNKLYRRKHKARAVVRYIGKSIRGLTVTPELCSLPPQNTSRLTVYSYAIVNRSHEPIRAQVEVSPDRQHFAFDRDITVKPGQTAVLVPTRFLKYTRISVQTVQDQDSSAECDVFFQAQTFIGFKPAG